jgi:three-Cys-motif partner protein
MSSKYDEIGYWSEVKLEIVKEYASTYSRILSAQESPSFYHVYVDAFAGAGVHISRSTKGFVPGSPLNALLVEPPFKEYYFIDLERQKVKSLQQVIGPRYDVHIYEGDCNDLLLTEIFPRIRYDHYERGLCLLDPYGLHLNWDIIQKAGEMKSIEIFLNFPVADMNRNVLWRHPEKVPHRQRDRMNAFWGDNSWRQAAYVSRPTLFGDIDEKVTNDTIAEGFRRRLIDVAGFEYVPSPMAMKNRQNAIVYYLFFASHKPVAKKIVSDILTKYSNR